MKILLCNRDESQHVGGDMVQLRGYEKALKKLGHEVTYRHDLDFDAFGFDEAWLHHINFGWTVRQWRSIMNSKVPYRVISIFYPGVYSDTTHETMLEILQGAKAVYSLSPAEDDEFHAEFPTIQTKIIDNGVDKDIFNKGKRIWSGERVLAVGRYCKDKGQVRVIESCVRLKLPVITIGTFGDAEEREKCNRLQQRFPHLVECLDTMSQEKLAMYYKYSRVFVCASESERNNLSILEAAACGTTVVDSKHNRASAMHQFKTIDPLNEDELDAAILEAWNAPIDYSSQIKSWDDVVKTILA